MKSVSILRYTFLYLTLTECKVGRNESDLLHVTAERRHSNCVRNRKSKNIESAPEPIVQDMTRVCVTSKEPRLEREPEPRLEMGTAREIAERERERDGREREKKKNAPVEQLLRDSPECRYVICVYERAGA